MPKIQTKTPEAQQIGDVEDIEGIGPKYAKILKELGINTTEDLRKQSMVQITEATDISTKLVYKWQCMADLFRVRRAAEEYTEFLFEMGIETVRELSEQDPGDLHARVEQPADNQHKRQNGNGGQGDVGETQVDQPE